MIAAMICMITSLTSEVTTALNATPMTTATARSSTFPRITNLRKSSNILLIVPPGCDSISPIMRAIDACRARTRSAIGPRWSLSYPGAKVASLPRAQCRPRRAWCLTADQRLRALARRQHGVFLSLGRSSSSGFTRPTIPRRLERGVWEEVMPRVYRSSPCEAVDWRQITMAAHARRPGGVACRARPRVRCTASSSATNRRRSSRPRPSRTSVLPAAVHTTTDLALRWIVRPCDGIPATTAVAHPDRSGRSSSRSRASRTCSTPRSSSGWSRWIGSRREPRSSGRRAAMAAPSCWRCSSSGIPTSLAPRTSGRRKVLRVGPTARSARAAGQLPRAGRR